jgi:hypothetical protein
MLIILLVTGIVLIVLGIVGNYNWRYKEGLAFGLTFCGSIIFIITAICCAIAITSTIMIPQMENRIAIYQEENTRIEEQIKTTIQVYQDYEKDIFGDIDLDKISSEKLILLTSIYPELKSDAMVQELIQVYIDNTNELKQLKMSKFDHELWRWWLCFV